MTQSQPWGQGDSQTDSERAGAGAGGPRCRQADPTPRPACCVQAALSLTVAWHTGGTGGGRDSTQHTGAVAGVGDTGHLAQPLLLAALAAALNTLPGGLDLQQCCWLPAAGTGRLPHAGRHTQCPLLPCCGWPGAPSEPVPRLGFGHCPLGCHLGHGWMMNGPGKQRPGFGHCLVAKSCPTLCDRVYCSPPGSSVQSMGFPNSSSNPIFATESLWEFGGFLPGPPSHPHLTRM